MVHALTWLWDDLIVCKVVKDIVGCCILPAVVLLSLLSLLWYYHYCLPWSYSLSSTVKQHNNIVYDKTWFDPPETFPSPSFSPPKPFSSPQRWGEALQPPSSPSPPQQEGKGRRRWRRQRQWEEAAKISPSHSPNIHPSSHHLQIFLLGSWKPLSKITIYVFAKKYSAKMPNCKYSYCLNCIPDR